MFEADGARAEVLGARECAYWQHAVDCTDRLRAARPGQFFDVDHRRFHSDPLGTIRALYAHFDLGPEQVALERMRRWVETARLPGTASIAIDWQTMASARQVRESFAAYCARHALH